MRHLRLGHTAYLSSAYVHATQCRAAWLSASPLPLMHEAAYTLQLASVNTVLM